MASSFDHQWKACQREIKATSAASETTALNTTSEALSAVLISEALSAVFLAPLLSKGRVTSNTVFVPHMGLIHVWPPIHSTSVLRASSTALLTWMCSRLTGSMATNELWKVWKATHGHHSNVCRDRGSETFGITSVQLRGEILPCEVLRSDDRNGQGLRESSRNRSGVWKIV